MNGSKEQLSRLRDTLYSQTLVAFCAAVAMFVIAVIIYSCTGQLVPTNAEIAPWLVYQDAFAYILAIPLIPIVFVPVIGIRIRTVTQFFQSIIFEVITGSLILFLWFISIQIFTYGIFIVVWTIKILLW